MRASPPRPTLLHTTKDSIATAKVPRAVEALAYKPSSSTVRTRGLTTGESTTMGR
jgi:hypothetical protein